MQIKAQEIPLKDKLFWVGFVLFLFFLVGGGVFVLLL